MMNKLNQIKAILGLEVKLEIAKLKDGASIEVESLEVGSQAMLVVEDADNVPLDAGEYELEDGRMLVIGDDGVITEIKNIEEEEPKEEEMETDEFVTKKEFDELKEVIANLSAQLTSEKEEEKTEVKEEEKTELAKEEEGEKITHTPEKEEQKDVYKFSQNGFKTTQQRVNEMMFKK